MVDDIKRLHEVFLKNNWSLAVAESCTAGLLSHLITELPGASRFFLGALVAYDVKIKTGVLGVPEEVISQKGVVSKDCAISMAKAVRRLFGATFGVSTTGNLGPEAQGGRPVGEVYIGLSGPEVEEYIRLNLHSDRTENKAITASKAIEFVLSRLG